MSYRPLLELGAGGMARIVLALATGPGGFNKLVVLKGTHEGQDSSEIRRLLRAEARLSARLNHPNVVQVQEVVEAEDTPYLVLEYLDGRPLSALRVSDTFTPGMRIKVISEALVGLHYAHELTDYDGTPLHIVHRDVSPHNVFLTYDGVVKVLDFGIAKMRHDDGSNTETGEVKGKLAYMAPEQLQGGPLDRRADIFAVGSMLWEAATGARMWANISQANLMHRLNSGDIPRPSEAAPIDAELERIIVRATAASPEDRYPTALALQRDLESYLEDVGQRVPLREVGAVLANAYASDRQERARAIKEALRHNSVPPPPSPQLALTPSAAPKLAPVKQRTRWLAPLLLLAALGLALLVRRIQQRETAVTRAPARATIAFATAAPRLAVSAAQAPPPGATASPAPAPLLPKMKAILPAKQAVPSAPPAAVSAAAPNADCDPPYFFDHGIKRYKPDCL